jgi:methyl-accepting chemotaxis protein
MTAIASVVPAATFARDEARPLSTVESVRRRGVRVWAAVGWIGLVALVLQNLIVGAPDPVWILLVIGTAVNAVPTAMALRGRYDFEARMVMGALAVFLPAMIVFQFQGHPWQMDAHMYFFVAMSGLVFLADWRPILVAVVLTALHHLMLQGLAPAWVFTGSGHIARVVFHAVAVILEFVVLGALTVRLERLLDAQDNAIADATRLAETAETLRVQAEQALGRAEASAQEAAGARADREAAARRVAVERRGELMTLAAEFERSVTSVVKAIGVATERLELSAVQLGDTTQSASSAVSEVTAGASRAAIEINQVTGAIGVLAASIGIIENAASEQTALTEMASDEAQHSVATIHQLERQASQIEHLLDTIREIAGKTNLLALNATIEAARAGEAGRGFTVVAGEVKALAGDTTRASDQISALLDSIRSGVGDSAATLRSVNDAIGQVAAAATGIAAVVDQHRATATGVQAGADRATRSASDIEHRMGSVADAAGVAATLCVSLRGSASELSTTARELRASTDMFVSFLRDGDAVAR